MLPMRALLELTLQMRSFDRTLRVQPLKETQRYYNLRHLGLFAPC